MGEISLANKRIYYFPVENPIGGDDIPRIWVPRAFVVQEIRALKIGGGIGTFDFELRHSPSALDQGAGTLIHSDTGVSNQTTGEIYEVVTDFAAITIPSNDWAWLELPVVSTGIARPVAAAVQMIGVELGP